jgi:polysaccharide export outer membrane protein
MERNSCQNCSTVCCDNASINPTRDIRREYARRNVGWPVSRYHSMLERPNRNRTSNLREYLLLERISSGLSYQGCRFCQRVLSTIRHRDSLDGADKAMFSISGRWQCGPTRWFSLGSGAWAVTIFVILHAWAIDPVAAQSPAAQAYRIGVGDKIGVAVIGQPDLSSEAIVDQGGNLRLPVVGDVHAADLTPSELEKSIAQSLEQGYLRRPVVSVKIAEFRPIYVLGTVRTPGLYPFQQGQSVLAAIARAGGIGASESGMGGDLFQMDERVRVLEVSRAAFLAKQARLIAQQSGADRIDFPDMSALAVDPARIMQIRDGEERVFTAERQAEQQEAEALRKQFPRLEAEIASLNKQSEFELRQRELNKQLIADYDQLAKSGLARKPTYVEIKREEARIEGNIERLKSEALKSELAIGDLHFRIAELRNNYQRRAMAELRETERALLELSVTLPSAQRARAARAQQLGFLTGEQRQQPAITVTRLKGATTVKYDAGVDFLLQPGDVVQVGSLLPPAPDLPPNRIGVSTETKADSAASLGTGDVALPRRTVVGAAQHLE